MIRFMQEFFAVLAITGAIASVFGVICLVASVVNVQPMPFEIWRMTMYAIAAVGVGIAGSIFFGQARLNRSFLL